MAGYPRVGARVGVVGSRPRRRGHPTVAHNRPPTDNDKLDYNGHGAYVQKAIARGVSVYQGNLESAVDEYPPQVFDYAILSQTLQETRDPLKVLRGMLRIATRAVVAFPNFGHWTVRLSHLWSGRAPKTELFPHDWYDSPNIHFLTVLDFEQLAEKEKWRV